MPCSHKFIDEENELLPQWNSSTLIIGTFNPQNEFCPNNVAGFYYQRPRNYFWRVLPLIAGENSIENNNTAEQLDFLHKHKIGITDILVSINDAEENNEEHINLISTVKDNDIELFNEFTWNTQNIIQYIIENNCSHIYFTRLGNPDAMVNFNSFEHQMRIIEDYCNENNIYTNRLHSPTGMGLGPGPRIPTLLNRWIAHNGADQMPFYNP